MSIFKTWTENCLAIGSFGFNEQHSRGTNGKDPKFEKRY